MRRRASAVDCTQMASALCAQVLAADPDVDCYEGDHITVMAIAGAGLLIYTVGYSRP